MTEADPAEPAAGPGQQPLRTIGDVETLKALADPLRLRILATLMRREAGEMPVMSVKELAARLDEPQTKLYRHVRQLEAVGLIKAVASRVVSGIVEHRYQACQDDLMLGPALTDSQRASAEVEAAVAAVLDLFRREYFAAYRSGLIPPEAQNAQNAPEPESHRTAMLSMNVARLPASRAAAIRERLQQVLDDVAEAEATDYSPGDEVVTINVLLGYFSSGGN